MDPEILEQLNYLMDRMEEELRVLPGWALNKAPDDARIMMEELKTRQGREWNMFEEVCLHFRNQNFQYPDLEMYEKLLILYPRRKQFFDPFKKYLDLVILWNDVFQQQQDAD